VNHLLTCHSSERARLDIQYRNQLLFAYRSDEVRPYIHPLRTLKGRMLSAIKPEKHPWHLGLFFSWKYVDGVNFWEFRNKGAVRVDDLEYEAAPFSILLTSRQTWVTMADERKLLDELLTLRVHGVDPESSLYFIDFEHLFRAKEKDILLDRTEMTDMKPWGGYAGLSFRPSANLDHQVRILNSNGSRDRQTNGEPARWVHLQGFCEREPEEAVGLAILDHQDNPRFPSPFFTMDASMEFPFLSASFIFHEPYLLRRGEDLTLRYRVIVHDGQLNEDQLELFSAQYCSLK
jgi:hypothetical protein